MPRYLPSLHYLLGNHVSAGITAFSSGINKQCQEIVRISSSRGSLHDLLLQFFSTHSLGRLLSGMMITAVWYEHGRCLPFNINLQS